LAEAFERMLADLDAVLAGSKEAAEGRAGLVRLAVLPLVGATVLPPILAGSAFGTPAFAL
jgi:DNA-binding transcriptional LysR family regulator